MLSTDSLQYEQYKPDQIVTIYNEQSESPGYSGWKSYTVQFIKTLFIAGLIFTVPGADAKPSRRLKSDYDIAAGDAFNNPLLDKLPSDIGFYLDNTSSGVTFLTTEISPTYADKAQNNTPWSGMDNSYKRSSIETEELKCTPNSSEAEQGRLRSYLQDMREWFALKKAEGKKCSPSEEGQCEHKKLYLLYTAFCNKEKQKKLGLQGKNIFDAGWMTTTYNHEKIQILQDELAELTDSFINEIYDSCENNQKMYVENNHLLDYLLKLLNSNIQKIIQLTTTAELTSQIDLLNLKIESNIMPEKIKKIITYINTKSPKICDKMEKRWKRNLDFIVTSTIDDIYSSFENSGYAIINNFIKVLTAYGVSISSNVIEYQENENQLLEILNRWTDHDEVEPYNKIMKQQFLEEIAKNQKKSFSANNLKKINNYKKSRDIGHDFDEIGELILGMKMHYHSIKTSLTEIKEDITEIVSDYKIQVTSGKNSQKIFMLAKDIKQQQKAIKRLLLTQQNLMETLPYKLLLLEITEPEE